MIDNNFLLLMTETLSRKIAAELKAPLMEMAEKQIDEAVTKAVEALRPRVEAYIQEYDMTAVVNLVIQRSGAD